ncbi:MAG: helix-turn-helix domain-containing protein [Actinomycetota bacterium]
MNTLPKHLSSAAAPPDFLTVDEAARVVRIGRTTAYDIARLFIATEGADGLPVVRFGKQMRVPRYRLEEWLGGPITWPIVALDADPSDEHPNDQPSSEQLPIVQQSTNRPTTRKRSIASGDQPPRLFSV